MEKVTKVLKAVWNTNKKKASFWVSGFSMVAVAVIVILKWFVGIDISATNITMGVALAGAFIAFVGNVTSNKALEEAGGSLDVTKITNTANDVVDALNKITAQNKPETKATTEVKAPETKATTEVKAPETKATTTPDAKANSLGISTDADGNIVVTVVNAGTVANSTPSVPSTPATTNTTNFK